MIRQARPTSDDMDMEGVRDHVELDDRENASNGEGADVVARNGAETMESARTSRMEDDGRRQGRKPAWKDFWEKQKAMLPHFVGLLALSGLVYASLFLIFGDPMLPGGEGFALGVLYATALVFGWIVSLTTMPGLIGMLVAGLVLRNLPGEPIDGLKSSWSSVLRDVALAIILLRGGIGLDLRQLKRLGISVVALTLCPQLVEAVTAAGLSIALFGLDWLWGLLGGFILGAVSPAVIVPLMLHLQGQGYGKKKGVPTMILAAAGLDDAVAITLIGVILGAIFQSGGVASKIIQGPVEVAVGILSGVALGFLSKPLVHAKKRHRIAIVPLVSIAIFLLARHFKYSGAGALFCMSYGAFFAFFCPVDAFVAEVDAFLKIVWKHYQPLLFSLVGAALDFSQVSGSDVGLSIVIILVAAVARSGVAFLSIYYSGLTIAERLFVAIAWLPKATVQAVMGPLPLDQAEQYGDEEDEEYGLKVLTLAVMAILITAPIGAIGIQLSAPCLLEKDTTGDQKSMARDVEELEKVHMNGLGP